MPKLQSIAAVATIIAAIIAIIALIPAFGQWLSPRTPVTSPNAIPGATEDSRSQQPPTSFATARPTPVTPSTVHVIVTPSTEFTDWQVPVGHDGYVEYRRCSDFPNANFPEFSANTPGYIHLNPQAAEKNDGKYTWCFQARLADNQSDNFAVYFCATPKGDFCAEPDKVLMPEGAMVDVDNGSCVLAPVLGNKNGISLTRPRTINVTLPGNTVRTPTITVGPYLGENPSYIACR